MGRRQPADIAVDMTPFSDMTFQLMIFFIVVNDMSQKELEDLKLPAARVATEDKPEPGRPVLNILEDGTVKFRSRVYYDNKWDSKGRIDPIRPGRPDYYWSVHEMLATKVVPNMETAVDPEHPALGPLPDEPLLIRADRNTPFKYIQRVMEVCSRNNVKIWKIQLAVSEGKGDVGSAQG